MAQITNNLIATWYEEQSFEEIVKFVENQSTNDKNVDDITFTIIAAAYANLGRSDCAQKYYELAIQMNVNAFEAKNNLAVILMEKGDTEQAEKLFLEVIEFNPKRVDSLVNIGNLYYNSQSYSKAEKYYSQALKIDNKIQNLLYQLGMSKAAQGHFEDAIKSLQEIYREEPENYVVNFEIGTCNFNLEKFDLALASFKNCAKIRPEDPLVHLNIGICQLRKGNYTKALTSYETALAYDENLVDALYHTGLLYVEESNNSSAITSFTKALAIDPDHDGSMECILDLIQGFSLEDSAGYDKYFLKCKSNNSLLLNKIANHFLTNKKPLESLRFREKLLANDPDNPQVNFDLARTYHELKDFDQAIWFNKKAIELNPQMIGAMYNIALIYTELKDFGSAEKFYQNVLDLDPNNLDSLNNLAALKQKAGEHTKALDLYRKSLKCDENNYHALYSMTGSLRALGKKSEAKEVLEKLLSFDRPDRTDHVFIYNSLGTILQDEGDRLSAITAFEKALQSDPTDPVPRYNLLYQLANVCDWKKLRLHLARSDQLGITEGVFSPFGFWQYKDAPENHLQRARRFTEKNYSYENIEEFKYIKPNTSKIKIGFFSADFRQHPVTFLSIRMLELLNRNKFTVFAYSFGPGEPSVMRNAVINAVDIFREVQEMSDAEVISIARKDKLDIAIDLTGYTDNHRAGPFAHRVAPIQINFLGYPGTTGAIFMDYIICDNHVVPVEFEDYYSEKKIFLPDTYMPTDNTRPLGARQITRTDVGLPEQAIVLCCFNNNYKITYEEFDCWCEILKRHNNTVLWLKASNDISQKNLLHEANLRGVDKSRIIFAGFVEKEEEHIERQTLADLFIDTFNFNAHTTATEALWAGVPIVTKSGKSFGARVSGSLLKALEMDELVTNSKSEYIEKIEEIICNPNYLNQIKLKIKKNLTSKRLFNTEKYTEFFENAMEVVFHNYTENNFKGDIKIKDDHKNI